MTKKDWRASRVPKRKPKLSQPAPAPAHPEPEPEQPEEQWNIPPVPPPPPQMPMPLLVPVVQVQIPMWPMEVVNLPGQLYRPIPHPSIPLVMMHEFSTASRLAHLHYAARARYVDEQVPFTRHVPSESSHLHHADGQVPLTRSAPNESLEKESIRKPNAKVSVSRTELNAAIAMSMLDDFER